MNQPVSPQPGPTRPVLNLQGTLFEGFPLSSAQRDELTGLGYRGPTACAAAGITYRQLDYWARTGLVEASVREASGSGTQRLFSFRDILVLKIVKKLLDAGISLQNIRTAIAALRERGIDDLGEITLMSDGTTVYECTSTDEVVDLLQGGQAVFGIAVGRHLREVEGTLAALPGERAHPLDATDNNSEHRPDQPDVDQSSAAAGDELSNRRQTRTSA